MIRFLKHLIAFLIFIVIMLAGIYVFNRSKADYTQNIKADVVVTGDSHMACAFNPKFYPGSINISQTAEPLIASFYKLKELISKNSPIDTVIIGLSYNSLSSYNDEKFVDPLWADNQLERTSSLMSLDDYSGYTLDTGAYHRHYLKNLLVIPQLGSPPYIGHFIGKKYHLDKVNVEDIINKHFYQNDSVRSFSENSFGYLDSIIQLVKREDVVPVILCPPLHQKYRNNVPEVYKTTLDSILNSYNSGGVVTLNYTHYELSDTLFADYSHLNKEGAAIFTKAIKERLSEN